MHSVEEWWVGTLTKRVIRAIVIVCLAELIPCLCKLRNSIQFNVRVQSVIGVWSKTWVLMLKWCINLKIDMYLIVEDFEVSLLNRFHNQVWLPWSYKCVALIHWPPWCNCFIFVLFSCFVCFKACACFPISRNSGEPSTVAIDHWHPWSEVDLCLCSVGIENYWSELGTDGSRIWVENYCCT